MPIILPSSSEKAQPETVTGTVGKIAAAAVAVETDFRKSALYRNTKRIVILIVGGTILLIGIALIVLPGPAFIVIPAGLSILAIEFAWARRWIKRAKSMWEGARKRFSGSRDRPPPGDGSSPHIH